MPAMAEREKLAGVAGESRRRLAGMAFAVLAWLAPVQAQVEAPPPVQPEKKADRTEQELSPFAACRLRGRNEVIVLDEAARRVQQTVCGAALWFDGLFGEKGDVVAARSTYGRVEVSTDY